MRAALDLDGQPPRALDGQPPRGRLRSLPRLPRGWWRSSAAVTARRIRDATATR